jgi:hypothetical protein
VSGLRFGQHGQGCARQPGGTAHLDQLDPTTPASTGSTGTARFLPSLRVHFHCRQRRNGQMPELRVGGIDWSRTGGGREWVDFTGFLTTDSWAAGT